MTTKTETLTECEQDIMKELETVLNAVPVSQEPINARYELIIDMGKPFSEHHSDLISLKGGLTSVYQDYIENVESVPHLDIKIFDDGKDITESQFIRELISEITGDDEITEPVKLHESEERELFPDTDAIMEQIEEPEITWPEPDNPELLAGDRLTEPERPTYKDDDGNIFVDVCNNCNKEIDQIEIDKGIFGCPHCKSDNNIEIIQLNEDEPEALTEPEGDTLNFSGHIEPKLMKAFFQGIGSTVDKVKISITRSGWHLSIVDPAHVQMSQMTLKKAAFFDYKCIGEGNIGIDVDNVLEVIKAAKKGDSIGLSITEHKIVIRAGIVTRELTPVDLTGMCDPKIPNLNLPGHFSIKQEYLVTAFEQCSKVSDHITISANNDGITVSAVGEDERPIKADIPKDYLCSLQIREAVQSKYDIDYIMMLSRQSNFGMLLKGQELSISMGDCYPFMLEAETDQWEITYLLAPRIDTE